MWVLAPWVIELVAGAQRGGAVSLLSGEPRQVLVRWSQPQAATRSHCPICPVRDRGEVITVTLRTAVGLGIIICWLG